MIKGRIPALTVLATALVLACGGCRDTTTAQGEQFVQRWQLLYNSHDVAGFTALYAPEGNYTAPGMLGWGRNPAELRATLEGIWRRFPDMHVENPNFIVAGDDRLAFYFTLRWTPMMQAQAQTASGATFVILENGRIKSQVTMMGGPGLVARGK